MFYVTFLGNVFFKSSIVIFYNINKLTYLLTKVLLDVAWGGAPPYKYYVEVSLSLLSATLRSVNQCRTHCGVSVRP